MNVTTNKCYGACCLSGTNLTVAISLYCAIHRLSVFVHSWLDSLPSFALEIIFGPSEHKNVNDNEGLRNWLLPTTTPLRPERMSRMQVMVRDPTKLHHTLLQQYRQEFRLRFWFLHRKVEPYYFSESDVMRESQDLPFPNGLLSIPSFILTGGKSFWIGKFKKLYKCIDWPTSSYSDDPFFWLRSHILCTAIEALSYRCFRWWVSQMILCPDD